MAKELFTKTVHTSFPGRLNFAHIAKPGAAKKKDGTTNDPKYSCSLIQKVNPHTNALIAEIEQIGFERFGEKWRTSDVARRPYCSGEKIIENYKAKLAEQGGDKTISEQMVHLYTGKVELKASGRADKDAPRCYYAVQGQRKPIEMFRRPGVAEDLKLIEEKFYNGSYCSIAVTGMTYSQSNVSWGVTLILKGIKFIAEGDRLGAVDLEDAFSQEEEIPADAFMDEVEAGFAEDPENIG